jgi:branched-chain amino acid transport system permease protein
LNGISYAFILFLLASGLSLILGVMGILNMAHGSLYILGAYLGLTAAAQWDSFVLSIISAAIGVGIIGLILERAFLKFLYKKVDEQALLTIGFIYIIANIVLWIWGPLPKMGKPPAFFSGSIRIGQFFFPTYRLFIILAGLLFFGILWWLQDNTRIGAIIRGGMDNKEVVESLGINYGIVSTVVFIVGAMLGGVAGLLGAPIVGVYPEMSMPILLLSFIVIIVGGVGKVQGALLGSLIIGIIDTFGKVYFPEAAQFTVYSLFIIMLMLKPNGLLGRKIYE